MRQFAGLSLSTGRIPDETTILNFRHLLEQHQLGQALFDEARNFLGERGLLLKSGTIVDASLIDAPSSTKNQEGQRDPEMHQTRKGNQWYFGMKMHIGVDDMTGVVHSLVSTAANVNDVTQAHHLLHGEEERAFGDAGYQGVEKRSESICELLELFRNKTSHRQKEANYDDERCCLHTVMPQLSHSI